MLFASCLDRDASRLQHVNSTQCLTRYSVLYRGRPISPFSKLSSSFNVDQIDVPHPFLAFFLERFHTMPPSMPFSVVYFSNSWAIHFSNHGRFGYNFWLCCRSGFHIGVGLSPGLHIQVAVGLLHGRRLELGMWLLHGRRLAFAHQIL